MKMNYLLGILVIFSVILFGCAQGNGTAASGNIVPSDKKSMEGKEAMMAEEGFEMMESYNGKVLAGTITPYLDFDKADYDKALKENKIILLNFYASWCPICRAEQQNVFSAFNDLNRKDAVGFRVNFRDSDTDADEEALAKEFGVSYQHTKIILKDGQKVLKAPDSWDKQRYLNELAKI